ncbi:SMAD/FHA domain-containing protein [Epithele typhae]|uniref:SMAD/FHA domain-containing protein n=1 Tax=Epithele typhae TaxID=378194 RepID=UPI002007C27C|nr:SMAD/FHA domain-containing protein [Epithele typhae]KAH9922808.1 SMAD/FHA domain-containing protein [Epithele typhae]
MPRHSPRPSDRKGELSNYRDDRRREGPSRRHDDDRERDRDRERNGRRRDDDRDYGRDRRDRDRAQGDRRRDDRRGHDRDRDQGSRRVGPSRRSASPRARSSRADSRARSASAVAPDGEAEDKAKPNFGHSGLLAADTKTVQHGDGTKTVLKYHEPPEARKPSVGWRLYVFKGKEQVDLLHIQRQSAYLVGRDRAVVDIAVEHPSCSKQHAAIQYRQVQEKSEFGDVKAAVKPYIIDLESTNGTVVNDSPIPTSRYCELILGDVIKFGESNREYVLLSEDAA